MRPSSSSLLPLLSLILGYLVPDARADDPLTTVAEIRALKEVDAATARSVKLRGMVTYVAPVGPLFIVQDETGGICVSGARERMRPELRVGSTVELEAVTAVHRGIPHVTTRRKGQMHLKVVSSEQNQLEPKPATVAQLALPQYQEVRVEVTGVIRSMQTEPIGATAQLTLLLTLADGRNRLTVAMPGWRPQVAPAQHLVGATVRVRGVYSVTPIERQPLFPNRLYISSIKDVQVETAAGPPFAREAQTVASVRELAAEDPDPDRLRVRGVATVSVPGKGMFVQDQTGGIWVDSATPAESGDQLDAVGFPTLRDGSVVLEDGVWRRVQRAAPATVPLVTAADAMTGSLDGSLVQIEALLLAVSAAGEGPTLVLQNGDRVFLARCGNPKTRMPSLGENSWLKVTGVCVNTRPMHLRDTAATHAGSFHLLISGPQSVEIARTPTWWTVQRIVTVVAALAVLALAAVVWATTLRRRVTKQTDQIREHLAKEAVAEERLRIARELHDSVQQDLLGITMQLKATERLFESAPDKARHALSLASAMARRSQAETHRAVWDLREAANEHSDLVVALDEMVSGMCTEEGVRVEFSYTGDRRSLPQTVESHVLRVAQEAVTNAVKHGEANRVDIVLHFGDDHLTLMVRDDGKGFDADHPPSATSGHFGLFGMRERAIKLNGEFRLTSKPGSGTAVHLEVPLPAETGGNETLHTGSGLRLIPRPSTT